MSTGNGQWTPEAIATVDKLCMDAIDPPFGDSPADTSIAGECRVNKLL